MFPLHSHGTYHIIVDIVFVVIASILNQSRGHWFLSDALNATISMNLKLKEEMNHFLLLDALIDDDDFCLNIVESFCKKH
jgi:hypothetical protein